MLNLKKLSLIRFARSAFYCLKIESEFAQVLKDHSPPKQIEPLPSSRYGGEYLVTLLTGRTSLGKQGSRYIRTLFGTAKAPVFFEHIAVTSESELSLEFLLSVMRNRCAIHVDIQNDPRDKHNSLLLASDLDLFACIIKMRSFCGFNCKHPDLDIMLITQNNSGDFSKLEYEPVPRVVETLKISDQVDVRRFLKFVFSQMKKNCRKKVTIGHKANKLPKTDGMFIDIAQDLQCSDYPDLEIEFMTINKMALLLVMQPQIFDVICTGDRYADIIISICSGVCGGASLASAVEMGDHHAIFKPLQTKLSITDNRNLSPYGIVCACVDLLTHLGSERCGRMLWQQLLNTMLVDKIKTSEFGGSDTSEFVICNIVNKLKCQIQEA